MYVSLSVSRSGFICMFFLFCLYICTYLPYLPTFACMWFDTENFFSFPFVLYLFLFRTRFSQEGFRFSLQDENPPYL